MLWIVKLVNRSSRQVSRSEFICRCYRTSFWWRCTLLMKNLSFFYAVNRILQTPSMWSCISHSPSSYSFIACIIWQNQQRHPTEYNHKIHLLTMQIDTVDHATNRTKGMNYFSTSSLSSSTSIIILLVCSDYNVKEMFIPYLSWTFQAFSEIYTDWTASGIRFSGISLNILLLFWIVFVYFIKPIHTSHRKY
jgi:hypothetical protein